MDRVERVEELLLKSFFTFDELNVIDEQYIDFSIAPFELDCGVLANRVDELIEKGLGRDCLLYTSPSPRDRTRSRMPSSA